MAADNIDASLQPGLILRMGPAEYISHLRTIVTSAPAEQHNTTVAAITRKLQSHVHSSAIPPVLFAMWLPMALPHSPQLLKDILSDKESRGVWKSGRRQLRRTKASRSWSDNEWEALGGVESIRSIFNSLSVSEVHPLVMAIAAGARSPGAAGSEAVDHLLEALTDDKSEVKRLEMSDVAYLLMSCSSPFIIKWLSKKPLPSFPLSLMFKLLVTSRIDLARNIATGAVTVHPEVRSFLLAKLPSGLIWSTVPYVPKYTPVSLSRKSLPGMRFCLDLLHSLQAEQNFKTGPSAEDIINFVYVAKRHAIRHKLPFDDMLSLLQTGMATAALQDEKIDYKLTHPHVVPLLRSWAISKYPDYVLDVRNKHNNGPLSAPRHPSRPNAKHEEALEELVVQVIKSIPEKNIPAGQLSNAIWGLFQKLPHWSFAPVARLPLIKLLCRHVSNVRVDLDRPQLTMEDWERIHLDILILANIPSADSKWLFSRLPNISAAETLIEHRIRSRYLAHMGAESPWWFKHGVLRTMWEADDADTEDSFRETLILLEKVKKEAEQSRDPDIRANWAMKTVLLAECSKNVAILKDVTVWSRRYIRDPIVFPVMTSSLISMEFHSPILSCVAIPPNRRPTSLSALKAAVDESHSVILLYIEAALLYLREPSFQRHVYRGFRGLVGGIFKNRINGIETLRKSGLGSESQLTSILIESMMPILMRYEEAALADGSEPLGWDHPNSPLGSYVGVMPRCLLALPFLDKLARRRDELWTQRRLKRDDLIATLDEGWPKGLPIQCLLREEDGSLIQAVANPNAAPFIADRVRKVLFCDAETALTAVPRNMDVIGEFVDSLAVAIRSYVGSGHSTDVLAKIQQVWEHYSNVIPVTAGHMKLVKSILKKTASAAGTEWTKADVIPVPPSLPLCEINSETGLEPVEWDPRPDGDNNDITETNVDEKPKNLLLCRLSVAGDSDVDNEQWHWRPSLEKPDRTQKSFWGTWINEVYKLSVSSKDALVASAILYLDTFAAGGSRLLSNQFPAGVLHPRYPPMYLSNEFLSRAGKSSNTRIYVNDAILALEKLKSVVPPLLLRDLADSMLNKLVDMGDYESNYPLVESATFKIISLLSLTDQPHLASDLGLKVIEKMPDSSSWHRRVISVGLCKRLTSTHAEEMLRKFSHFIINSLQGQHERNKAEKEDILPDGEDSRETKYAKVTTMKLLAELLENGNLVSDEISLGILRSLLLTSNHIDVKAAALSSIRELLWKSVRLGLEPNPTVYRTFCSFADAAAGPDERSIVPEAEWLAAENGGPLPKCNDERPLLELFLTAKDSIPDKYHEDYVRNVLLRILDESMSQHTRWMRIFLGRFKLSAEEASVAYRTPFLNNYSQRLLSKWSDCIPKSHLLLNRDLSMGYRDCDRLARIDKKLAAKDRAFGQTDAGEHWQCYLRDHTKFKAAFEPLGYLVRNFTEPRFSDGISLEDAEEEYFRRVAIAAREPRRLINGKPIVSLAPFEFAVSLLLLQRDVGKLPERRRRLLERIVADVSDLHAKTWPDGSSERPPILPSLWNLRCTLAVTSPLEELVERVNSLCEECAQSLFAMGDYEQLKAAVSTLEPDSQVFLIVKLGAAAQNDHGSFGGCIKVQLVHHLLPQIHHLFKLERSAEVKSLLKSWLESSNENIRRIAFGEMERLSSSMYSNNISPAHFDDYDDSEYRDGYEDGYEDEEEEEEC